MTNKVVRLSKALRNESIKRLPWIFLIFLVLLFAQFVRFNSQTAENTRIVRSNSTDTKTLLQRVADLSADNKRLTEQNLLLSKLTNDHVDCLAKLFARYTQDRQPVSYADLTTCVILTRAASPTASPSASGASRQALSGQSGSGAASSSHSASTQSSSQSNSSQPSDVFIPVVTPLLKLLRRGGL